jgi:hypothetical protein
MKKNRGSFGCNEAENWFFLNSGEIGLKYHAK